MGHPGLCLEQCQIRVVAGFGSSLAYCPFISQIERLFLTRVWLSNLNTNLNQTEVLSLSDSHKSWIKNSWKCCQNIWMKGWPKIRLIMKFPLDCSPNRNPDHAGIFESTVFFLFLEMICLCWSAGEFFAGEILCVHLLVISSFSSVFPLLRITMATGSRRSWVSYNRGWITQMWMFSYIFTLLAT